MDGSGAVFFSLLLLLASAQQPCTWQDDKGNNYDLTGMMASTDYFIPRNTYPKQDWDISINVCKPVSNPTCGTGVIACQIWDPNNGGFASLGQTTSQSFQAPVAPGLNGYGVTLEYTGGDGGRQTEINFACNPDDSTPSAPEYMGENPALHYQFVFKNKWGCPTNIYVPVGNRTLSGGSIILIVLLVCVVVYLVGGILFNKFKRGLSGAEVIPNVTFWTSIPGLVKDGCLFIVNKIRGLRGGGYQSV